MCCKLRQHRICRGGKKAANSEYREEEGKKVNVLGYCIMPESESVKSVGFLGN